MEKILKERNKKYIQFRGLLNLFISDFLNDKEWVDIDDICLKFFKSDFEILFKCQEFVTIYNYLDALIDAKEHEFTYLFGNSKINYPYDEALHDLNRLIKAIDDSIIKNQSLSDSIVFKKIKEKVV